MDPSDLEDLFRRDEPAWVVTAERAHRIEMALAEKNLTWGQDDEEIRRTIHGLWPDLAWDTIEQGLLHLARSLPPEPQCDGLCVMGYDILGPEDGVPMDVLNSVAEAHPGCPLHAPDQVCGCEYPDRCMSPTHGRVALAEALAVRYRQNPSDPRAH